MGGRTDARISARDDPGRPGWSLRRYLAILVLLFVLAAGSGIWYGWAQTERDALAAAGQDASIGARLAAEQIGETAVQVQTTVAQLAASPGIRSAFGARAEDCTLAFGLSGEANLGHLDLVRADGSVACSSRPPAGATDGYAGADWLGRALREPVVAAPVTDRRTGRQALAITTAVAGHGLVGAFVDLATLATEVAHQFGGARQLEFLVLSADSTAIVTRTGDPQRWIGSPVRSTRFTVRTGTSAGVDVAGVQRVYAQQKVAGLNWRIYAGADRAQALASARRLVWRQSLILLAGLIVGLLGTLLVYRGITRPISRLSVAVRTAAAGAGASAGASAGAGPGGAGRHETSAPAPREMAAAGPREVAGLARDFTDLVAAVGRELDERRRAEQTAREFERNYRQLFDSNPHPMYVFDIGTLALLEVNDAAVHYYGYSRPELLAMDVTGLCLAEDVAALTEAADRSHHRGAVGAAATGQTRRHRGRGQHHLARARRSTAATPAAR